MYLERFVERVFILKAVALLTNEECAESSGTEDRNANKTRQNYANMCLGMWLHINGAVTVFIVVCSS